MHYGRVIQLNRSYQNWISRKETFPKAFLRNSVYLVFLVYSQWRGRADPDPDPEPQIRMRSANPDQISRSQSCSQLTCHPKITVIRVSRYIQKAKVTWNKVNIHMSIKCQNIENISALKQLQYYELIILALNLVTVLIPTHADLVLQIPNVCNLGNKGSVLNCLTSKTPVVQDFKISLSLI